jgi:hypothetical protein
MGIFPRIASLPRIHIVAAILLALLTALGGGAWAYLHPDTSIPTLTETHSFRTVVSTPQAQQSAPASTANQASVTQPVKQAAAPAPHPDREQSMLQAAIDQIATRENFLRSEIRNIHSEELYRAQRSGAATPDPATPSLRIQALSLEIQKLEAQRVLLSKRMEEDKSSAATTASTGMDSAAKTARAQPGTKPSLAPSPTSDRPTSDRPTSERAQSTPVNPVQRSIQPTQVPVQTWQWTRVSVPVSVFIALIAAAGLLAGVLYLLAALRRFRSISSLAALESILPADILMLGSIPETRA